MSSKPRGTTVVTRSLPLVLATLLAAPAALVTLAGPASAASTFVVNSTGDGADASVGDGTCATATPGECTLRAAIQEADGNGNATETDTISFGIPAAQCLTPTDVCTISPASALPDINQSVTIDGYTQTGASPNTVANGPTPDAANAGSDAQIKIELNGTNTVTDGLRVDNVDPDRVTDITIRGLAINRFTDDGISVEDANRVTIVGNHIGTDPAGAVGLGNGFGVFLNKVGDSAIGGASPAARNVLAGSRTDNVLTSTTTNLVIANNYVGTDADGTLDLGSGDDGMDINGDTGSSIGGGPAARNVSFGNGDAGMEIFNNITKMSIVGNKVSGNTGQGVDLTTATAKGVTVSRNSISGNGALGIDLAATSSGTNGRVNLNDDGDPDDGANHGQNYPVLQTAVNTGGAADGAVVSGSLNSTPSTAFTVELFSSASADPTGFGEGETYAGAGQVTTDASGNVSFAIATDSPVAAGRVVTATATDNTTGETSEFSSSVPATGDIADVSIQNQAPPTTDNGQELDYTLTVTNAGPDIATGVTVTDALPQQVEFVSASAGCTHQNGTVACDVADLAPTAPNNATTLTIRVRATSGGDAQNSATVDSDVADPANGNDTATATTTISSPGISVGDVRVDEGGRGTTAAVLTVTLADATSSSVTVDYATADGTAAAGSDYTARSGTVTFAPGDTTQTIPVPVTGDARVENDETFFVNLSNPRNAEIADGQGKATILDNGSCTITGTRKDDVLAGTPGKDVICGLGGDDVIRGLGGDDVIRGGTGDDKVLGGAGDDGLFGGAGNDRLIGGAGDDELYGRARKDGRSRGAGNDDLRGGGGDDLLYGGAAKDELSGGGGRDEMHGGAGNDGLSGGAGDDELFGEEGDDRLAGGPGRDLLNGGPGRNVLIQ